MRITMNAASEPPATARALSALLSRRWMVTTLFVVAALSMIVAVLADRAFAAEEIDPASSSSDLGETSGAEESTVPATTPPAPATGRESTATPVSDALRPVGATACVVDRRGEAVENAIVEQYVDRTWGWGGRTGNDGCVRLQAPTGSARFRVWVGGLWLRVDQNVGVDPLVVFELVDASVEVVDSVGGPVRGAVVEYFNGRWRRLGRTDASGVVTTELLPVEVPIRVWVGGLWLRVDQNVGVDPLVVFELVDASVEVVDSVGGPVRGAVVEYFNGRWRRLGRTDASGVVTIELLPVEVPIRVWVGGLWLRVDQNVGVDPLVVFELVDASVEVVDSVGGPVRGAVVEYFNGRWRRLGRTDASGVVTIELLPVEVPIRVSNHVSRSRITLDLASVDAAVVATQPLPENVARGAKAIFGRGWQWPRADAEYLPGDYRVHWADGTESRLTLANTAAIPHDVDVEDPSASDDPGTSGHGEPEK